MSITSLLTGIGAGFVLACIMAALASTAGVGLTYYWSYTGAGSPHRVFSLENVARTTWHIARIAIPVGFLLGFVSLFSLSVVVVLAVIAAFFSFLPLIITLGLMIFAKLVKLLGL